MKIPAFHDKCKNYKLWLLRDSSDNFYSKYAFYMKIRIYVNQNENISAAD